MSKRTDKTCRGITPDLSYPTSADAARHAAKTAPPVVVEPGLELLGEVITWSMKGAAVLHSELLAALLASGLDTDVIKEMMPRHAFSRACGKLRDQRIIRKIDEDEGSIRFQFTTERRGDEGFDYAMEAILTLSKADGAIACDIEALAERAEQEFNAAMGVRTPSDVTSVVQRLFAREADLFSIREQGGCYFVPRQHAGLVDRVEAFLTRLGGAIGRFPVPKGTRSGDASVRTSVAEGMAEMIAAHEEAIASFDVSTHDATLERRAEQIRVTRHKLMSYAEYLGSERERLEAVVAGAADALRAKVAAIGEERATIEATRGGADGEPPEREPCVSCGTTRGRRNPHGFAYARSADGLCGSCKDKYKRAGRPAPALTA